MNGTDARIDKPASSRRQPTPDDMQYVDSPIQGEPGADTGLHRCLLCGHLKPASQLASRRLFGTDHLVCADQCGA